jgi:hypothetical protein
MEIDFPLRGLGGEVRSLRIDPQRHNLSPHRSIVERVRGGAERLPSPDRNLFIRHSASTSCLLPLDSDADCY